MPTAENLNQIFSYQDYLSWPENERWEIINGNAYNMSPAPNRRHQKISGEIFRQFANYLEDKKCEIYDAPFDVRLPKKKSQSQSEIINVVQPDLLVVCDDEKLDDKGCIGAPDLIIEITSPSTALKDFKEKYNLYESFKVKEYWIVLPGEIMVLIYKLKEKKFSESGKYSFQEKIPVGIFNDLEIDLKKLIEIS